MKIPHKVFPGTCQAQTSKMVLKWESLQPFHLTRLQPMGRQNGFSSKIQLSEHPNIMLCHFIIITPFLETEKTVECCVHFSFQQPTRMQCPGLLLLWRNDFPTSFTTLEHSMLPGLSWMCPGTHVSPARIAGTED